MNAPTRSTNFSKRAIWISVVVLAALIPILLILPGSKAQRGADRPMPDVVQMVGPVSQDEDLRSLPYIPPTVQAEPEVRLVRHPPGEGRGLNRMRSAAGSERDADRERSTRDASKKTKLKGSTAGMRRASTSPRTLHPQDTVSVDMPSPTQTFAGMTSNLACGTCLPPDTDGDVGPNHYIQSANSSIRVHDKAGNVLAGPITYNSFFSAMGTSTPCGSNLNQGDGIVFYDHIADRWIVSDFAWSTFPGPAPFHQCIGVSKTSDPVAGGWWLYAVQVDPSNPTFIGDYPKFGLWSDGYYMSVNMFANTTTFSGVRVFALDRASMINGGAANTIAFTVLPANLGDQYSFLPATYRTGLAPPAGQPEWFMDINSSSTAGTVENQIFVRRFHADFATPANSFFGVGATHTPDGIVTVNGFVNAEDATVGGNIVPNGTATTTQYLDTLGDKLMYPLVYQNLGGTESIWSSHTVNNNQGGTGPTAVRWYQFNMTGNTIPATPAQQQTFNNGGDGLWRWMPSINVDNGGNAAIGYSTSSATLDPGIRYAGRLAGDPANTMGQGEAIMTPGTGHQTDTSGRWGDYSSMFVDPTDTCTFYHTNEYYSAIGAASWNTRVGSFKFPGCVAAPIPTPTPTPTPSPTASPTPPISAGPITVTATVGTPGPTDYATLKAAFDTINAGTHRGTVNIFVLGNTTETVAAVLNASGTGSSSYTSITMTPSGTRTITGNLATPLVDLNGADNVTIDGKNSGGNTLSITNTNTGTTTGTSTIRFINGAQNNTVKNCSILGSATVAVSTAGGNLLFSTSPAVGTTIVGNNNNTLLANNIGPAGANLPIKAISAVGTTTNNNTFNTGNIIDGNNIFDFFGTGGTGGFGNNTSGIDIRGGNGSFTIQNNRIYQTATRTFTTTALRYAGITVSGSTTASPNFHTIRNNVIGFGAANGTGTMTITGSSNEFRAIDLPAVSSTTATSVQGNIISGINQTTSRGSATTSSAGFTAISLGVTGGVFDVGNVSGNIIGSLDGSSTIVVNATTTTAGIAPVIGIFDFSFASNNISNNNIGSITINSGGSGTTTGFRGILISGTPGISNTVNNNTIGGTAAGSITDNIVGSYAMYGIQTAATALSMTGNTIRNMVGNANVAGSVVSSGLAINASTATDTVNLSRNTIHSLSNASGAASTSIYAIDLTLPTTASVTANVIERNLIHSLSNTSTDNTSQLWGIVQRGSATVGVPVTAIVRNNMIRLGLNAAGSSITSGFSIIGIRDIQGAGGAGTSVVNYQFNSVYIGGTGVASSSSTFCFNGGALTNARNYSDNIFYNARSNASGAGKNYAISLAGTAPNPAGLTSNYNDLFVTGTGGFVGVFNAVDQTTLANWQTATGQDANSVSVNPLFVAPNGTASTGDIHLTNSSPVLAAGTPVAGITNDFDNDTRDTVPDIGADEIVAPTTVATTMTTSPATGTYAGTVNLSATLTSGGNPVTGKAVNFLLNDNPAGSGVTNGSGVATVSNVSLAGINAGNYIFGVFASFAGDANFLASNNAAALTVNKADTTTTVSVSNANYDGNPHGGSATVTGPGGLSQSVTVSYSGRLSTVYGPSNTPPTNAGDYTASANYAGDSNYNPSNDSKDYSIAKANQTINFGALSDKTYGDADFGVSATATSGLTVSFAALGNCTVTVSTVHITGAGSCTITASQPGDNNYNAAPDVPQSFNIAKANTTTTVTVSNATYDGNPHGGTANVTGPAGLNQSVTVSYSGRLSTVYGPSNTPPTDAGDYTASANYAGDSNYNPSNDSKDYSIAKANQTINFGALSDKTYGDADFGVSATATSGLTVSFAALGNCTVTVSTVHITGAGSCTITASQPGDNNYNAAPDVPQSFNIAKADTTTTVTVSNATYDGNPHGGSANVTGPAGLNQSVTVSYSGRLSTVYGPSNTAPTNAGDYTASANYAGDSNYNPSTDSKDYSIAKANTTTTVTANNATYDGSPHGGSANVMGPAGLNQSVTVSYSGRLSTVYGPSNTAPTNAGDYTASANYAGDANYNSSSDSKDYSIAKATPVITWSNPADIIYGTALSGTQLNATANTPGSFVYTPAAGTVLSYGNGQNLHVAFTPTDTANWNNAMKDVSINVKSALLTTSMTVDRNPALVGYNHNYLIAITNNGNAAATSMTLTDPLPSQVRFTAVTTSQGTCSYDTGTHTVNCTLGTLGIGSTINIQLTTKTLQTGTLNNTATVNASQWDPATGGNTASVNGLPAIAQVDLSVSKVDSADPIYVSQLTTYTMVVKNYNTPISATGVVLSDNLPGSMQFVSATTTQGSLVTPPVNSTGIVTANIGTLAVNATATVTVTVRATAPGTITNTASASANENESNPANNSASQATTVLTATLQKVLLAKQVLTGGCENTTGNAYLTGPAPAGGLTVSLASDISGATVPASVFIPAGQSVSPAFNVTTSPVAAKQVGLITATLGVSSVSRNLTINVGSGSCPP